MASLSHISFQPSEAATRLLDWYDTHRRTLPWRAEPGVTADPYHVWLSEIMLQQTTVATVKSYFERFLTLWPRVEDMAASPLDDILREWAGLGYYARARNLHKCAVTVASEHGGRFPDTVEGLKALPGIGDYSAAAIASIAFGRPAAVVDGNVERIMARLLDTHTPLPKLKAELRETLPPFIPKARPGDFAQASMDLGATICTPKKPNCLICPWRDLCQARAVGSAESLPVKAPKKAKPTRRAASFWLIANGDLLLERRPEKGLLGAMPGLPSTEWVVRDTMPARGEALVHAPIKADWSKLSEQATHTFTHFHLITDIYVAHVAGKPNRIDGLDDWFWHPVVDIKGMGLPTVFKKMAKLV